MTISYSFFLRKSEWEIFENVYTLIFFFFFNFSLTHD